MKILRIALRNLASLAGTHTVDFTREPLRSAGLFSISGPTGSGKSTLLDALCLALYECTPRLDVARGGQIPDGARTATLTPRDPGNLLRRGATDAFAEVAFVGVDGATYTARWSIRRARNRPDGNLQNAEMVLFAGNVAHPGNSLIVAGGKKTEVAATIVEKVGLSYQQFTRAVLLAQNDFAAFLKSNDTERASILEALTGTEKFARMSRLVFERHKRERETVSLLESKLEGTALLAAEARAAAEVEHKTAAAGLVAAEAALTSVQQHLRWFERTHALTTEVDKAAALVVAARAALDAAAPREADLALTEKLLHTLRPLHDEEQAAANRLAAVKQKSNEAEQRHTAVTTALKDRHAAHAAAGTVASAARHALAEAQPALERARLLDSQITGLAPRLAAATTVRTKSEAERLAAEQSLHALRRQLAAQETNLAALTTKQAALAPYAPFAEDLAVWRERFAAAENTRSALNATSLETAKLTRRAEQVRVDTETARTALAEHQRALDQATAAHTAAEQTVRAFDAETLAARRLALEAEQAALIAFQSHLARVADLVGRHRAETATLSRIATERDADAKILDEIARTRFPAAASALAASHTALKLLEAAADRTVPKLRAALLPEHPCPVCGSLHHPAAHAAHETEPAALGELRAQVAAYQKAHDDLRTEQTRLQTSLDLAEKNRAARQQSADHLAAELASTRATRPAAPALEPLLALPDTEQSAAVEAALAKHAVARTAHEQQERAQRTAGAALTEATRKLDKTRPVHADATKKLAGYETNRAAAEASLAAAKTQLAAAETDLSSRLAALEPLLQTIPGARAAFAENATAFAASFTASVDLLRRLRQQFNEVTALRTQDLARLPGREESLATATQALTAATKVEADLRDEQARLQYDRQSLFAGRAASVVQAELEKSAADAKGAHEARARDLVESDKAHAAATEACKTLAVDLASATTAFTAAQTGVDRGLARFVLPSGKPFDRSALTPYLTRDADWLATERRSLAALRDAFQTFSGQHAAHAAALEAHRAQPSTADSEESVRTLHTARMAELTVAKDRDVQARAMLASDDQRRQFAANLLKQIEERRALIAPWGCLDELIGSADGAKFRAIVQRHALDILLGHANAQLDLIAARYRLERLPDSLNLIVCDRDMADERRSVHSLSGGESFLVSLALALGLASLTSNRLRVESLFIDEGFGSLDPETLETAMNALMRLESQGRKVGVISHVTEMADAIPVQIRVVKGRGGASRLEVPGADPASDAADTVATSNSVGLAQATAVDIAALGATLLTLLRAARADGSDSVSSSALRKRLGCDARAFDAVRTHLGAQIATIGRSLSLAPVATEATDVVSPSPRSSVPTGPTSSFSPSAP